ncbi:MAG TPA: hypothetical protein VF773_09450 [Verrucomicrobiae bacterium]
MNTKIDIQFVDEPSVEIPAVTATVLPVEASKARRHFWLRWQLFKAE